MTAGCRHHQFTKAARTGFIVGLVLAVVYVASSGNTWLFIPTWADILFYPGFVVGLWVAIWFTQDFSCLKPSGA